MTDDWNPNDPDATRVLYDLAAWSFDQQAELASDLAEAEIPHTWEGAELVVPEDSEAAADAVITEVERRLGIVYDEDGDTIGSIRPPEGEVLPDPVELSNDEAATEYDLADWPVEDRDALTRALTRQQHPFRWEGEVLLVRTADEALVESLLDLVEAGEDVELEADDADEHADDDRLPFETLTTFFLAGERLKRNPLDADGLEDLLAAVEVAEPERPPFGVDQRLWERTCELADQLAGALVDDDVPDEQAAQEIAESLHDLLRPYI
ncbi:MAG: hypothetical protein HY828_08700 [Actinobacteria bacterium]|nr:hypothetical protein [Actinomycetota bacterium]